MREKQIVVATPDRLGEPTYTLQHETLLVDDELEVEEAMVEEMTRLGLTDEITRMNASAW